MFEPKANSVELRPGVTLARSEMAKVIANQEGKCVSVIHERLCIATINVK